MNSVYYDYPGTDNERRELLYGGQLFVYSPRPSTLEFCHFARTMIEQSFGNLNPEYAQDHLAVEQYAEVLGELKPAFIHHPQSKVYIQAILADFGCDLSQTYFDVPRMRSSTSGGYLTGGMAYAWHPHRDTWYSAPDCQINWWIPIYDITKDNAMAFHPCYWARGVTNDSAAYDYEEWNTQHRFNAVQYIKNDPRPLPRATVPIELDPQLRLLCPAGGVICFSAAQMHSSVLNTSGRTRFSIDFRTVHLADATEFRGAPNVDAACTGTTMNDYLRGTDLERIPQEIIARHRESVRRPGISRLSGEVGSSFSEKEGRL
jgi:hypothetical protein